MSENSQTSQKSGRYFIILGADNFILNQAIFKEFDPGRTLEYGRP